MIDIFKDILPKSKTGWVAAIIASIIVILGYYVSPFGYSSVKRCYAKNFFSSSNSKSFENEDFKDLVVRETVPHYYSNAIPSWIYITIFNISDEGTIEQDEIESVSIAADSTNMEDNLGKDGNNDFEQNNSGQENNTTGQGGDYKELWVWIIPDNSETRCIERCKSQCLKSNQSDCMQCQVDCKKFEDDKNNILCEENCSNNIEIFSEYRCNKKCNLESNLSDDILLPFRYQGDYYDSAMTIEMLKPNSIVSARLPYIVNNVEYSEAKFDIYLGAVDEDGEFFYEKVIQSNPPGKPKKSPGKVLALALLEHILLPPWNNVILPIVMIVLVGVWEKENNIGSNKNTHVILKKNVCIIVKAILSFGLILLIGWLWIELDRLFYILIIVAVLILFVVDFSKEKTADNIPLLDKLIKYFGQFCSQGDDNRSKIMSQEELCGKSDENSE